MPPNMAHGEPIVVVNSRADRSEESGAGVHRRRATLLAEVLILLPKTGTPELG